MDITMILKPEAIRVLSSASSKKRLFHSLGDMIEQIYDVPQAKVVEALQERDPSAARTAVEKHLDFVNATLADQIKSDNTESIAQLRYEHGSRP